MLLSPAAASVILVPMASRSHAVPGHVNGTKLVYSSGGSGTSVGCLPFSQNRQSLPNYPDIVDNEICFQPVNSESSINELSPNDIRLETAPASVGLSASSSNHDGVVQERPGNPDARPVMITDSRQRLSQGGNAGNLYPALVDVNLPPSGGTPGGGHPRTSHLPPYRQIQTRDISVGISTRLDPHQSDALPDLLHSHVSVPVTPTRPNQHRQTRSNDRRGHGTDHRTRNQRHRNHEGSGRSRHANRRSRTRANSASHSDDGVCKEPCVKCFVKVTSFRWVLVVLSMLGVCCVVTGIVLAALHAAGNSFLFLAIMFIGLGVLLVIVVGVGWKCTPRGHEPLHALFGLGDYRRRRERRGHRTYRPRDGNWYGGVVYPEFQYRRPPPSYAASMQEYQQQLALAQQQCMQSGNGPNPDNCSLPSSPPPSYRSRTSTIHSGIHIAFPQDGTYPNSQPPTYRSQAGRHQRPPLPLVTSDDGSTEVLPGGDVSFAGPEPGVVHGVETNHQNVAQVLNGNVRHEQNPSTVAAVSAVTSAHQVNSSTRQYQNEVQDSAVSSSSGTHSVPSGTSGAPPGGSVVNADNSGVGSRPYRAHSSVNNVPSATNGLNSVATAADSAGSGSAISQGFSSVAAAAAGSSSITSSGRTDAQSSSEHTDAIHTEQTADEQPDHIESSL
ncbi:uncharacterized protein LOC121378805 [Gigantopelta aegis]|uniref:uncharacterized protein LOC121378805 n=1 Tax=Gigantopelta aegis TaxID=1735272 RepID=UPI001B888F9D|nr:uncharacterized protein LOC121378805 [Gigantopelta aegis]